MPTNQRNYMRKYMQQYRQDPVHAAQDSYYTRRWQTKLRAEVIAAYGSRCSCCGEDEPAFLTVDHVENDGASHRRDLGCKVFYLWLKKNGFPKGRFRLLCFNCNCGRQMQPDRRCPHEKKGSLTTFTC